MIAGFHMKYTKNWFINGKKKKNEKNNLYSYEKEAVEGYFQTYD